MTTKQKISIDYLIDYLKESFENGEVTLVCIDIHTEDRNGKTIEKRKDSIQLGLKIG